MSDPKHLKPPGIRPPAGTVAPPGAQTGPPQGAGGSSPAGAGPGGPAGKVVHDDRGNAVWDWLKETGRNAIDSTSRLLRKLETPGLKMEDKKDEELRLTDDDAGDGYDPYNQRQTPRKPRK
ncbi:MAG TPA: hypothetical protein VH111_11195 [Steroidobacteraceae bacterium]|nr:hypothetical protein [Steroidobacteraceae bacterium]